MALSIHDVAQQMRERGIEPPALLDCAGKKQTWAGNTAKPNKKNAWAILSEYRSEKSQKTYIVGVYGMGDKDNWFKVEPTETEWSPAERLAWLERRKELDKAADAVRKEQAELAVVKAKRNWDKANLEGGHPYLDKKKVGAFGLRFFIDKLIIPLRDVADKIHGLQYINQDGSKLFGTGTVKEGHFHLLGDVSDGLPIAFAEGYATAASVHMATGWPVVTCFDAGNLMPVITAWRKLYEDAQFVIAADDDKHLVLRLCERLHKAGVSVSQADFSRKAGGLRDMSWQLPDGRSVQLEAAYQRDKYGVWFIDGSINDGQSTQTLKLENAGRSKAMAAGKKYNARVVSPAFDLKIHAFTDFNDLHCAEGLERVREQLLAPPAESISTPIVQPTGDGFFNGGGDGGDAGAGDSSARGLGQLRFPFLDDKHNPKGVRENVYYALYEDPALHGMVKMNQFSHQIDKLKAAPWHEATGQWREIDDSYLANYLAERHGLLIANPITIQQAVMMYATDHEYNPVREGMEAALWDGVPRLDYWMHEVLGCEDTTFARMAGSMFMMSMVARVFEPGCQMDYMLVLHGGQGARKSTVLRILGGEYFASGTFRVGDKDSLQVLQGRLIFNFNEFDGLNKSERTAVKAFVTERTDVFRPPYGKQFAKFPRTLCLTADTNEDDVLTDDTGDRRYWPVDCLKINIDKMTEWREQLIAEAVQRYKAGERRYPTKAEEDEYFKPEQDKYKRVDVWQDKISGYINSKRQLDVNTDFDGAKDSGEVVPNNEREFFSTLELLTVALNIDIGKVQASGTEQKRVSATMRTLGFHKHRFSEGQRSRGYMRTKTDKEEPKQALQPAQAGGSEESVPW